MSIRLKGNALPLDLFILAAPAASTQDRQVVLAVRTLGPVRQTMLITSFVLLLDEVLQLVAELDAAVADPSDDDPALGDVPF